MNCSGLISLQTVQRKSGVTVDMFLGTPTKTPFIEKICLTLMQTPNPQP